MTVIFFDLETSDKEPCAQILNYSFIRTNNSFEIEAEHSGDIALSILQIPSPEALLTNRLKILDHQASNFPREPEALSAIAAFIYESIQTSRDPVYLAGYNSARFDLPFLRTSMIRNGINPYFSGKLKYCDILHLVRKACLSENSFPETSNPADPVKLSLSLEVVSRAFGLLSGVQSHHSREDVLLTIKLAKCLHESFAIHPVAYSAYEPKSGDLRVIAAYPNYERRSAESGELLPRNLEKSLGLLNETYKAALWIDLEKYEAKQGRAAISWYNKNAGQLTLSRAAEFSEALIALHDKARAEFAVLTPDNFFSRSSCDIEQDIYRLDMQKISTLSQIIWYNERSLLEQIKDPDLQDLVSRYWLAYGLGEEKRGAKWKEKLVKYAKYRYGGQGFQLPKNLTSEEAPDKRDCSYHCTLDQTLASLSSLIESRNQPGDREILEQLVSYIKSSELLACLT